MPGHSHQVSPSVSSSWSWARGLSNAGAALLLAGALLLSGAKQDATSPTPSPARQQKRVLLMVDGVTPEAFAAAKARGKFARFVQTAAHVAPFPAISDYSWSLVLQGRQVFGPAGRIRHYEAAYFDEGAQRAREDGRFFFHRLANPRSSYAAVDSLLNPFIEGLAYFPTTEIRRLEIAQIEKDLVRPDNGAVAVGFLTVPDAIAHTRPEQLSGELDAIDAMIERVVAKLEKDGAVVRIDLIADHGQTGAVDATGQPTPMTPVNLADVAAKAGLEKVQRIEEKTDVVFPVLALGNYAAGWTATQRSALALARANRAEPFFDVAVVRLTAKPDSAARVRLIGRSAEAVVEVQRGENGPLVRYTPEGGDPLSLGKPAPTGWHSPTAPVFQTPSRPFALARIAETALEDEAAMPDVLLSFADGFRIEGPLEGLTTMHQTHGSLSASSSLGILASTSTAPFPPQVLSKEILSVLNLDVEALFDRRVDKDWVGTAIARATENKAVRTGANDLSNAALYRRMARVSDLSQSILREDIAEAFLALLPQSVGSLGDATAIDWRRLLTADEIAAAVDALLSSQDVDKLAEDVRLRRLPPLVLKRIQDRKAAGASPPPGGASPADADAIQPGATLENTTDIDVDVGSVVVAGRLAVMRAHGIRHLLEQALTVAETSALDDPRDSDFARRWHGEWKARVLAAPVANKRAEGLRLKRLFREILLDRQLAEDAFPAQVSSFFPLAPATAARTTVVYFPGIYDEVFDGQIFRDGLLALEDFGVRVLEAPTSGSCHAAHNAEDIAAFLDADRMRLLERGRTPTPYVFLGYSKGAVDALHFLASRPQWAREHLSAFVAVAAPLNGAHVLDRRDLTAGEVTLLTGSPPPGRCRAPTSAAGPSVTRTAMAAFFEEKGKDLVDTTRFFSLSFESSLKDAHLWMKLTKNIAGFAGPNDGVVGVSDSKFPASFDALDLGTLRADHLAGLPTANADVHQRPLFEAIYLFLQESGGLHLETTQTFTDRARALSPWATVSDRQDHLQLLLARHDISLAGTEKEQRRLGSRIERALAGTPYEVGPFDVEGQGQNRVAVSLRKTTFLGFTSTVRGAPVAIPTCSAFAKALLGALRQDGRDLGSPPLERWRTFPLSSREPFVLPNNNLAFDAHERINLRNLNSMLDGKRIAPVTRESHPQGIPIVMDRRRIRDFRSEYQFYWEDLSPPDADENRSGGWAADVDDSGRLMARLDSQRTSARLTSFSMRFRPADFPSLSLQLAVDENTEGADVKRGGSGRDDSAFQIWLVLREVQDSDDRTTFAPDEKVRLFGYYWSDDEQQQPGDIVENTYSERDLVIVQLPPSFQLALGNSEGLSGAPPTQFRRDLVKDLKRAYPQADIDALEVVAVTFQHDSNDIQGESRARFYELLFSPSDAAEH